jgi:flavorubredoxin
MGLGRTGDMRFAGFWIRFGAKLIYGLILWVVNFVLTFATAGILEMIEGLRFKNKKAASFGCYGWSGEAVDVIREKLEKGGFEIVNPGLKCLWDPDVEAINACVQFGEELGRI